MRRYLIGLPMIVSVVGCARPPDPLPSAPAHDEAAALPPAVPPEAGPPAEPPSTEVVPAPVVARRGDLVATAPEPRVAPPASMPASASQLETLLRARHADDLPGRAQLDAHPDAFEGLIWLAGNADAVAVRVRACQALGLYPERHPASELARLGAAGQPAAVRAGALDGLARLPAAERAPATSLIAAALSDADPRVSLAAVRAARGVTGLEPALADAAVSHPDVRVREAARER